MRIARGVLGALLVIVSIAWGIGVGFLVALMAGSEGHVKSAPGVREVIIYTWLSVLAVTFLSGVVLLRSGERQSVATAATKWDRLGGSASLCGLFAVLIQGVHVFRLLSLGLAAGGVLCLIFWWRFAREPSRSEIASAAVGFCLCMIAVAAAFFPGHRVNPVILLLGM